MTTEKGTKVWNLYKIAGPTGSYIGCTVLSVSKRWAKHRFDAAHYYRGARLLLDAIRKHGAENFKIELLEVAHDRATAHRRERELIVEHGTLHPAGLNLFCGSHADVTRQRMSKSAHGIHRGQRSGMAKLTDEKVTWARGQWALGRSCEKIGKQLGVHQSTISRLANEETWRNL